MAEKLKSEVNLNGGQPAERKRKVRRVLQKEIAKNVRQNSGAR